MNSETPANPKAPVKPSREYFEVGIALSSCSADKFLLIQEAHPSTQDPNTSTQEPTVVSSNGSHQDGTQEVNAAQPSSEGDKWRLPYDRLYKQDGLPTRLTDAASVIGTQLTAYDFDMYGICYIGLHEGPRIVIIYSADNPYNLSMTDQPDPEKVSALAWLTADEVRQLSERGLLRDPEITLTAIENVQKGLTLPSDTTVTYASE